MLTSLIATCLYAGVNAVEYLAALQEYRGEVFAGPGGVAALGLCQQPGFALGYTPEGRRAIWARSGIAVPEQNDQTRAPTGYPCVCAWWATSEKRPCESRFIHDPVPLAVIRARV